MASPNQHNINKYYKRLIKARIKALQQSQQQTERASQTVELDQSQVGRLSRMDALQMQQMELELGRRQSRELKALENALTRIQDNEYGDCYECDEPINPKRLEIDLTATLCVKCAEQREKL